MNSLRDSSAKNWKLVFLRYANCEVRWNSGGWVLMDCIFLVQSPDRATAIRDAVAYSCPSQPNPADVAPPALQGEMALKIQGAYEVIEIEATWSDGTLLGGRAFSFTTWDDVQDSIISEHKLVDSLPKKTGAQDKDSFALTPPRNRSEFDRQHHGLRPGPHGHVGSRSGPGRPTTNVDPGTHA